MLKSELVEFICWLLEPQPEKYSNRNSWMSFCRLLEPVLESIWIETTGTNFVYALRLSQKILKSELLELILSTSVDNARKCLNRNSWNPFSLLARKCSTRYSWTYFVAFWSQCQRLLNRNSWSPFPRLLEPWNKGQKILKSTRLGSIFSTSGPKARKCSNRNSWSPFCRLLCPLQENAEIGTPGAILSMSGPNAGKCLNRNSWNPFCRRLVPMPENNQIGAPGAHLVDF